MAKVIFLHLFVILFTGEGGWYPTRHWDTPPPRPGTHHTPLDQTHPPRPGTPPPPPDQAHHHHQAPPPAQAHHPPGPGTPPRPDTPPRTRHTPPPQTRHTTNPPRTWHTPLSPRTRPPPRQGTPPDQASPPEADSGIRSTSGRYASYWNAFLLKFISGQIFRHHVHGLQLMLLPCLFGVSFGKIPGISNAADMAG